MAWRIRRPKRQGWDFAAEMRRWGPHAAYASPSLSQARAYCRSVAERHYENFSVVSLFVPRRLIPDFHAVYAYCRWADDLADETAGGAAALSLLQWWREQLQTCYTGRPRHPVMVALQSTIRRHGVPLEPFLQLLVAFEQDQRVKEYATFAQLLEYCRHSANPVGHLVLYLLECYDLRRASYANAVCTGLQLANFWQDVRRDAERGRIYVPREDRERFGVDATVWQLRRADDAFRELMRHEVQRAAAFFDQGEQLIPLLPPRYRGQVWLFIEGGRQVLQAIRRIGYDVWSVRPTVSAWDKLRLMVQALPRCWF